MGSFDSSDLEDDLFRKRKRTRVASGISNFNLYLIKFLNNILYLSRILHSRISVLITAQENILGTLKKTDFYNASPSRKSPRISKPVTKARPISENSESDEAPKTESNKLDEVRDLGNIHTDIHTTNFYQLCPLPLVWSIPWHID